MGERVCAVIVTYNRKELLRECLQAVFSQTRPPDHVLVVDNASTDGTPKMLEEEFPQVEVLRLPENQGGAGGFHEGMKRAYEAGFDWLWLMDDDAFPESNVLDRLLSLALKEGFKVVGPLVVDANDSGRVAFPYKIGTFLEYSVEKLTSKGLIMDSVHLWNGVLLNREVISKVGLPNPKLFIRGEEVEYGLRLRKARLPMATSTQCILRHPGASHEEFPLLGSRLVVVYTNSSFKNFYIFRNRGYLIRTYGGRLRPLRLLLEIVRYSWFFLVMRKVDLKGWLFWFKSMIAGYRGQLGRPEWQSVR